MDILKSWLAQAGMSEAYSLLVAQLVGLALMLLIAWVVYLITKKILLAGLTRAIRRTRTLWDDALLDHQVLQRISHVMPALVIQFLGPVVFAEQALAVTIVEKLVTVYIAAMMVAAFYSLLDAAVTVYRSYEISRNRPIKGYVQVVKIVAAAAVAIFVISVLLDRSPAVLLGGLGALTAVLLLVFKDTILGFVASIQLVANDMVRMDDWISMPKYGADGNVTDITLTTIKVQNWDKTITTIPTYALIAESFKNWRGMSDSGGRRIKRSIHIDMNSVRFLTPEDIKLMRSFQFITEYVDAKVEELAAWNAEQGVDDSRLVNGRRMTNLGTFRAYAEAYLRAHPLVHKDMTLMVRQLEPGEHGIPIQVYCFSSDQEWIHYEQIQADLFDHIIAVIPEFGLRVYQNPSGMDLRRLGKLKADDA